MSVRRFSATSVLDVSKLSGYYNRLDVFVSFTDDGEYDLTGAVDGNIRPQGVYAYPINDVVGRFSRETTLYGRVFRYKNDSSAILDTQQYRIDDYELDYQKLVEKYPDEDEKLEEIHVLVPGQLQIRTAFAHLWQLTFRFAINRVKGRKEIRKEWARILLDLGYEAIHDKRANGIISVERRPALIVLGSAFANEVEDLEIVSTQAFKKELNSRMKAKIERFNSLTKVSNARNRIKK